MANHGFVTFKQNVDPAKISALLERLNHEVFKDILKIKFSDNCGPECWGKQVWEISAVYNDQTYGERICWMASPKKFEIRHGGGGDFIWWIDCKITNEIALEFNGTITDEGVDHKIEAKKDWCPTWKDYVKKLYSKLPEKLLELMFDKDIVPEIFKDVVT